MTEANSKDTMNKFEKKREMARKQLKDFLIKDTYYNMLNKTIIIDKLKEAHSNNFFAHYNAIEQWLDETNTEYYCKINYQPFLYHMKALAEECEVIYFGIALLQTDLKLKEIRSNYICFFSIYNIPIEFSFYDKFRLKRKEITGEKKDQGDQA